MEIKVLDKNNSSLDNLMKEIFDIDSAIDIDSLNKNIRFLCAFLEDKIIGTVMITTKYDPVINRYSYYLDYVSVLKDYQNKGIGRKLIEEVENMAIKENVSYIEFTSNKKRNVARSLYISLGYDIRDTDVFCKGIR